MTQARLLVVAPSVYLALCEHPFVQFLPALSIVLDHRLVWDPECGPYKRRPIRRIFAEIGLVKSFAGGCYVKEAIDVEILEGKVQQLDRQLQDGT